MGTKIKVNSDQRAFVMVYWDFIECDLLNWNEKRLFIILKKFSDSNNQCFPSIKTLCRISQLSKMTVLNALKSLEKKKVITIEHRKSGEKDENQSNLYTLHDYPELWNAKSMEQLTDMLDIEELHLFELAKKKGYRLEKEPGSTTQPKILAKPDSDKDKNQYSETNITEQMKKSQDADRYTLEQIKQLFDYDIMIQDHPYIQQDIDSVISILYTVMNTSKATIRIAKEEKPCMAVISKLMKLNKESILYAIEKYSEQTDPIKNPISYMLTILYNASEQYRLDILNQSTHNRSSKKNMTNIKQNNLYTAFPQRVYDYEKLEKELLSRDI